MRWLALALVLVASPAEALPIWDSCCGPPVTAYAPVTVYAPITDYVPIAVEIFLAPVTPAVASIPPETYDPPDAVTPEPTTLLLVGSALAYIGWRFRKGRA